MGRLSLGLCNHKEITMDNIFLNAKFGDKFLRRDGKVAIYNKRQNGLHYLLVEEAVTTLSFLDNGRRNKFDEYPVDIIKRL